MSHDGGERQTGGRRGREFAAARRHLVINLLLAVTGFLRIGGLRAFKSLVRRVGWGCWGDGPAVASWAGGGVIRWRWRRKERVRAGRVATLERLGPDLVRLSIRLPALRRSALLRGNRNVTSERVVENAVTLGLCGSPNVTTISTRMTVVTLRSP
jgi:hypothetical protein